MTDEEWDNLKSLSKASGYSISAYVRALVRLERPKPLPSADYIKLQRELSAIGNNLNQIARNLHLHKDFDRDLLLTAIEDILEIKERLKSENTGKDSLI